MQELGCWDALNLDGGGSSLLLLATNETGLAIMNRPSDPETRPVPVMLGLRRRPLLGR
jgi:exopolysaccharide biosynthesis protein